MPSKNYTVFFIFSVGFVLASIAFVTVLQQTSKKEGVSSDIRAKATVQNSIKLVGVITGTQSDNGTITVSDVRFQDATPDAKSMGNFTVTVPANTPSSDLRVGGRVLLAVDAATFNAGAKTMKALEVRPQ